MTNRPARKDVHDQMCGFLKRIPYSSSSRLGERNESDVSATLVLNRNANPDLAENHSDEIDGTRSGPHNLVASIDHSNARNEATQRPRAPSVRIAPMTRCNHDGCVFGSPAAADVQPECESQAFNLYEPKGVRILQAAQMPRSEATAAPSPFGSRPPAEERARQERSATDCRSKGPIESGNTTPTPPRTVPRGGLGAGVSSVTRGFVNPLSASATLNRDDSAIACEDTGLVADEEFRTFNTPFRSESSQGRQAVPPKQGYPDLRRYFATAPVACSALEHREMHQFSENDNRIQRIQDTARSCATSRAQNRSLDSADKKCSICKSTFAQNEMVFQLSCHHLFHEDCYDDYAIKTAQPICLRCERQPKRTVRLRYPDKASPPGLRGNANPGGGREHSVLQGPKYEDATSDSDPVEKP